MALPPFKYYAGRRHGKTLYFHILGPAAPLIGKVYYRPSEGWEYFYEISRETYAKHVPPIVLEQLETDQHPDPIGGSGIISHY